MKAIICKLFAFVVVALNGALLSTNAYADLNSGANCKGANLTQALQGIGNDQFGVKNNAPVSFFVVCPVGAGAGFPVLDLLQVVAGFPTGGGSMTCILRGVNNADTVTFRSIEMMTTGTADFTGMAISPTLDTFAFPNVTLVCPLDPGESVKWYRAVMM